MSRNIMMIAIDANVGLASVNLGMIHAIERMGIHLTVFKIIDSFTTNRKKIFDSTIIHKSSKISEIQSLEINYIKYLLSTNQKDVLMEKIIASYYTSVRNAEIVLIEGLPSVFQNQSDQLLNFEIAKNLDAEIILVVSQGNNNTTEQIKERIKLIYNSFGGKKNKYITGVILNKLNEPLNKQSHTDLSLFKILNCFSVEKKIKIDLVKLKNTSPVPLVGAIPWNFDLITPRAVDIAHHVNSIIINEGDINVRRIKSIIFCTNSILDILKNFCSGSLLIASIHRLEMLFAACLATSNGIKIGAVLLTDGYKSLDTTDISKLCECAFTRGLPVFIVNTNICQTSMHLQNFDLRIPPDDHSRFENTRKHIAEHIDFNWLQSLTTSFRQKYYLSSGIFRYQIIELARKAGRRIVLPEGNEPRTIKAASICAKKGIATCILLGKPDEINQVAALQNIKFDTGIEIINPEKVREQYVSRLVDLRKNKNMTEDIAREQLKDNVVLGTLMLEQDKVDGLVSGAIHSTANTIRPPLQLIKTAPNSSFVSSVFFMLLPDRVYVFGDCAININPTAEQLAEIAIQSAESAMFFGIQPRVAMLSYSTGSSGTGNDVEKVLQATHIVQKKRPDLMIDGPIQYDAAVSIDVAKLKAPKSLVAGQATVFIFPDLNSGNITYKAVQRSAELISIGPILQGMNKPVNDLSRGALVEDIIYTISVTAIQSLQSRPLIEDK